MSNKVDGHPSLEGGGNNRKRSSNNKQPTDNSRSYDSISFNKRSSSGRPGSPHRYFDSSYDIFMEDTTSDNVLEATSNEQSHGIGNQVVHRHLNGLCIVTAGNVIQQQLGSVSNDDNKEDGIQIKSIKYHIQPSKDSQSARGKMRTKKKKKRRKRQQQFKQHSNDTTIAEGGVDEGGSSKIEEETNHDGYVSPKDTLCTVTLSNGQEIQLKCCVEGTVIEINNRLVDGSNSSSDHTGTIDSVGRDVSLLMKEPLLDGYLAVIMPSRGVFFPPR